ncbi:MAG TPA: hypothetical protein VIW29_01140 [Polyangiaceae bacterium]
MSAPQLTDPGASGEWLQTAAERARLDSSQRRARFTRLVTFAMAGLTAFTLLGLACFAWRRHTLQAALDAPPPASTPVRDALAAPPTAIGGPTTGEPLKAAAPTEAPAVVAPSATVSARKPASQVAAKPSKKKPARPPLKRVLQQR